MGLSRRIDGSGSAPFPAFPALAAWVCHIAAGPLPAEAWAHGPASAPAVARHRPGEGAAGGAHLYVPIPATPRGWSVRLRELPPTALPPPASSPSTPTLAVASLTLHIEGSRWCHRVGRHHKGNKVMWTVEVGEGGGWAWQGCFDGDCRREGVGGYRSPPVTVPAHLLGDLRWAGTAR